MRTLTAAGRSRISSSTDSVPVLIVAPASRPLESARRPKGINNVWIDYERQRWFSAGPAVELDGNFTPIGQYRGFTIYARGSDGVRGIEFHSL